MREFAINRTTTSKKVDERLNKAFSKDTDYDIFHKTNGKIVVHFFTDKFVKEKKLKKEKSSKLQAWQWV